MAVVNSKKVIVVFSEQCCLGGSWESEGRRISPPCINFSRPHFPEILRVLDSIFQGDGTPWTRDALAEINQMGDVYSPP